MDRMERAGDLKGELVEFGMSPRFESALSAVLAEHFPDGDTSDRTALSQVVDDFLLEYPLPAGGTVVERFVSARRDLDEADREMLLSWRDPVEGIFRVDDRDGDALIVLNLVDEQTYRMRSNMGHEGTGPIPVGSFLITRLVPVEADWMISADPRVLGPEEADTVADAVQRYALENPRQVFRNPDKLALGWRLQAEHRDSFVALFGGDMVVVPTLEVPDRVAELGRFHNDRVRRLGDSAEADSAGGSGGTESPEPMPEPEPTLDAAEEWPDAETVALIYDAEDGLGFYPDFAAAEEAFAEPELIVNRRYREVLSGYLRDEDCSPVPIRRLAERDPAKTDEVFRKLLKKPKFSWERDGEALLRRYKPDYFAEPPLPKIAPTGSDRVPGGGDPAERGSRHG